MMSRSVRGTRTKRRSRAANLPNVDAKLYVGLGATSYGGLHGHNVMEQETTIPPAGSRLSCTVVNDLASCS